MNAARFSICIVLVTAVAVIPAAGQSTVDHEPWLNWDFFVPQLDVNDIHVVVENDGFVPEEVYVDPAISGWDYQGEDNSATGGTVLSWGLPAGQLLNPGGVVHMGAYLRGAGRITEAYWTLDGQRVAQIPIIYELTRVVFPDTTPPELLMRLQTTQAFIDETGSEVSLDGIRTWMDIPAGELGLGDINGALDLDSLDSWETTPSATSGIVQPDSFFDVFVGLPQNTGPEFEGLLYADVLVVGAVVGRFWNLNQQCPEPATLGLLGLGGLAVLRRRRR